METKIKLLEQMALDYGFTVKQEQLGTIIRLTFMDNGKVGMDMEVSQSDTVVPFARLTQQADASFADFALEVLGKEFPI